MGFEGVYNETDFEGIRFDQIGILGQALGEPVAETTAARQASGYTSVTTTNASAPIGPTTSGFPSLLLIGAGAAAGYLGAPSLGASPVVGALGGAVVAILLGSLT